MSTSRKYPAAKSTSARVENNSASALPTFPATDLAPIDEALADDGEVRAVVGAHGELLDPHAHAILDHRKAADHRAAVRDQRLGVVQGRAAIEADAEQQRPGIQLVELLERRAATFAEFQRVLRSDLVARDCRWRTRRPADGCSGAFPDSCERPRGSRPSSSASSADRRRACCRARRAAATPPA